MPFDSPFVCIAIGAVIGAIIVVILTRRWANRVTATANYKVDLANDHRRQEVAKIRAECDTRIQKAKDDFDSRYRQSKDEYVALVADLRKFKEPVHKFFKVGACEYAVLDSGIYQI